MNSLDPTLPWLPPDSEDGRYLVTGSTDGTVWVRDAADGHLLRKLSYTADRGSGQR